MQTAHMQKIFFQKRIFMKKYFIKTQKTKRKTEKILNKWLQNCKATMQKGNLLFHLRDNSSAIRQAGKRRDR